MSNLVTLYQPNAVIYFNVTMNKHLHLALLPLRETVRVSSLLILEAVTVCDYFEAVILLQLHMLLSENKTFQLVEISQLH